MKENKLLIIMLVSLLIIGLVILTNFMSFSTIENTIIKQLRKNQQIETDYAAYQIENHINQVKEELAALSKFPIMDTLDINKCSGNMKIIHQSIEGKISSLLRVDKDGNIIECSSPDFSHFVGLNIKNKDYFKIPKETNEPFIAGLVRQGETKQIIVSTPLFETTEYTPYPNFIGEFQGVLLSVVELENLYNLYLHPIIEPDKNKFLLINIDTEETILKSSDIHDYGEIKQFFFTNESKNINEISDIEGYGENILSSSDLSLGSETLRLIILAPLKNVGGEIESVQKRHLFSLGFVLIVIIGVFFFLISLYKSKEQIKLQLKKANVTLEELGINIEVEKDKYSLADISLDTNKVYLVKEDDENHAHELFISSLNRGFAGLGIVRDDPRILKRKYNLTKTSFIWMTKSKVENMPSETNIDNIFKLISEFVEKSKQSVILLDRLDYIITENKFENVIKKIYALKDLALNNKCIIILSVNPDLIEEPKLKAIEAETMDLYGKHLRKKVELSDLEMDILKFINEKNVINRLISFKDITEKFNITKPTTRAKINMLQSLGLLQVEQKGRFKSLKITSAGRRIVG